MTIKRAFTGILAGVALFATTLGLTPGAAFADTSEDVKMPVVAEALDATDALNGTLVAEPAPSKTDVDSAAVVQSNGSVADIPKDPSAGIELSPSTGPDVTINLPDANEANNAQRTDDGTVVYPASDGAASAVVPTNDGVQVLNTITGPEAATRYDYGVDVPDGGRVELVPDGSAQIVDASGKLVLFVGLPWAKDATGTEVPTHFEVEDTKLVQVVEHTGGTFTYPVVADPRFYWSWGIYTVKFNSAETGYLSRAGGAAIGAYLGGPGAAFFTTLGGDWWADYAAAHRLCLVYRVVPWYIWAGGLWVERC